MADEHSVIRYFRRSDPKSGDDTHYYIDDDYELPVDADYFLSQEGPDGRGPLLKKKAAGDISIKATPAAGKAVPSAISSPSSKEK